MRTILLILLTATTLYAQGTKADYERAMSLAQKTENTVFRSSVVANWISGGDSFWYRVQTGPRTHEFILVDCLSGSRRPAFDHAALVSALNAAAKPVDEKSLPIENVEIDFTVIRFSFNGKQWRWSEGKLDPIPKASALELGDVTPSKDGNESTTLTFLNRTRNDVELHWIDSKRTAHRYAQLRPGERHTHHTYIGHVWMASSSDGKALGSHEVSAATNHVSIDVNGFVADASLIKPKWEAFIRAYNIWLKERDTGKEQQLTQDGSKENSYGEPMLLSPGQERLVAMRKRPEQTHSIRLIESSPKEQVEPKLHTHKYLKPGDRIDHTEPCLFDMKTMRTIPVNQDLIQDQWSISDLRWAPDSSHFTFLYNARGHQLQRLIAVDSTSGETRTIVEESSKTFVDYSQKTWMHWLDKTGELLWTSERDGWNHLYLFDAKSGTLKNQVTHGAWLVRGVERVDENNHQIWLRAAGVYANQDPYYIHFARVNFDGSGFTLLTEADGTHISETNPSMQLSPNHRWLVVTHSRVDLPPVTELRDAQTGKRISVLESADLDTRIQTGWTLPERFAAKGRDGKTEIYGVIYKPSNFDPAKSYPVIEEIYAGPHSYFVPKAWGRQLRQHAIAELGFVVVQIDGMGTNWRHKAFHDAAWQNLKDSGFPDRIAWLHEAARTRPWMDLSRVGIYGGSAGGQSALAALLHHGDFYKVAVADCGCHDNRMDKIWWNEAWMGKLGAHYAENSNVTHAHKLQGKLLLIVGEMDTNVDPASTMQVVNALVKADKDFDLLIIPGAGHGAAETSYGSRRRMDFFVRHLLEKNPRN
jgi:dipeptidyl-peptidase 4